MKVKIFRYDGSEGAKPYYDQYELPFPADGSISVMDILDHVASELDPTLSYYKHSACHHGICGRCLIRVNGTACLACVTRVRNEELVLEPAGPNRIKDLVIR